jgi:PLP dependent protein
VLTVENLSSAPLAWMQAAYRPIAPMDNRFSDRSALIQDRIAAAAQRAGRDPRQVRLVAVAKTAGPGSLQEAWQHGQRDFGHNRVQALIEHHAVLPEANWHLIGPLQSNKARKAVERVNCIETLTDAKLAGSLNRLAGELRSSPLRVLIQVNLDPSDGRPGLPIQGEPADPSELEALCSELAGLEQLDLRGLMTIAPAVASPDGLHRHFACLRELAEGLTQNRYLPPSPDLSMGMSGDFEIAIEEGATLVRVGRALFPPAS